MIWSDIRALARFKLQDPNSLYWSDTILKSYANDTLDFLTIDAEANLRKTIIPLTSGTRAYDLPEDCYEVRGVRINGRKIFGSSSFQLTDLDVAYLTTTGIPNWHYLEDPQTIAFYPIPSWTASYTTFDGEYGEIIEWIDGSTTFSSSPETGIVEAVIDTSMAVSYFPDSFYGETIAVDSNAYVAEVTYVYRPEDIDLDSDIPDLPDYLSYAVLYGLLEMCFSKEGQTQNLKLAKRYGDRFEELKKEWFARNHEWARGQDQMFSQQPMGWGNDLAARHRVWP